MYMLPINYSTKPGGTKLPGKLQTKCFLILVMKWIGVKTNKCNEFIQINLKSYDLSRTKIQTNWISAMSIKVNTFEPISNASQPFGGQAVWGLVCDVRFQSVFQFRWFGHNVSLTTSSYTAVVHWSVAHIPNL